MSINQKLQVKRIRCSCYNLSLEFAVLIFVHELGHFIAARLLKVEVEEFGFGFPPRITKLFDLKGTAITLNWIPLGGFVRPKGENDPTIEGRVSGCQPLGAPGRALRWSGDEPADRRHPRHFAFLYPWR